MQCCSLRIQQRPILLSSRCANRRRRESQIFLSNVLRFFSWAKRSRVKFRKLYASQSESANRVQCHMLSLQLHGYLLCKRCEDFRRRRSQALRYRLRNVYDPQKQILLIVQKTHKSSFSQCEKELFPFPYKSISDRRFSNCTFINAPTKTRKIQAYSQIKRNTIAVRLPYKSAWWLKCVI